MRPHNWFNDYPFAASGNGRTRIFTDYGDDYKEEVNDDGAGGIVPNDNWIYGGFRTISDPTPYVQIDFTHEPDKTISFTKPITGYQEQTDFCTRIVWSEPRAINVVDSPNVKTFLASSLYDLSADQGQITFGWDALSGKGNNLYAMCETGVALLIADKRILSEANGNELALIGTDLDIAIQDDLFISKSIGMNDETWRSWAEYDNSLFWGNTKSAYQLVDNQIIDIAKEGKYHKKIREGYCEPYVQSSNPIVVGGYDILHNEYWLSITNKVNRIKMTLETRIFATNVDSFYEFSPEDNDIVVVNNVGSNPFAPVQILETSTSEYFYIYAENVFDIWNPQADVIATTTGGQTYLIQKLQDGTWTATLVTIPLEDDTKLFAYKPNDKAWNGTYDYVYDKYLSIDNITYASKQGYTYDVGREGYLLDGQPYTAVLYGLCSAAQIYSKEFIRIRIASDNKPTSVNFIEEDDIDAASVSLLDLASSNYYLKDYGAYEQYIPRKFDPPYDRMQGRILMYRVEHEEEEHFRIVDVAIQYKLLK
jgi:hypothetical protein